MPIGIGLVYHDPYLGFCLGVIVVTLAAISREDMKSHEISLHHMAVLVFMRLVLSFRFSMVVGIQGALVTGGLLGLIYVFTKGIGEGDIYLGAVLGSFFSFWEAILHFLCPSWILGGIAGVYLLAIKKRSRYDEVAFAPFLCVGFLVGLFYVIGGNGWIG